MRYAAVIAAWIAVLALLVWQSHGRLDPLLWGAVIASLASGAAIGSWWAIALPLSAAVLTYLVAYVAVPECSGNCEFGRIGDVVLLLLIGVPLTTAAVAAGVGARKIFRLVTRGHVT